MGFGGSWLLRLFRGHSVENGATIDNPATVFENPSDVFRRLKTLP